MTGMVLRLGAQTFVSLPQWPGPASVRSHTPHSGRPCVHLPGFPPARSGAPGFVHEGQAKSSFFSGCANKKWYERGELAPNRRTGILAVAFALVGLGGTRAVRQGVHVQPGWGGVGQPDWQAGGRQGLGPAGELLALQ